MEFVCIECGCQMLAYESSCPVCGNVAVRSDDELSFGEDYGELNISHSQVLDDLYLD